jgi:3-oxoacyl-[acyl-carrier protein] reductase
VDLGLDGRVALVAGGSSGIGLAIAFALAAEGARVAVAARDPERLAAAQKRIAEVARYPVHATSVDVTDELARRGWVDQVVDELGAVHIVLAGGGSPPFGGLERFALADYRAAIDQIVLSTIDLCLAALPHLRSAGWGRLLLLASETAVTPIAPLALSGLTRAALVRFAEGLAADVGRDGITVNVLAPGWTRTPPVERLAGELAGDGDIEDQLAAMGHHTAVGRIGRPEEIAAVAVFLASVQASYVTGTVHLVDGGAHAVGPPQPHH